jgi:hypothetical protein
MRLLFTKSSSPLSKLIRWGAGEPCSHFAIGFNDQLLFQSNLLGTGIEYMPQFLKVQTVVKEIYIPLAKETEDKIYDAIMPGWTGHPYDYRAFAYLSWRALLHKSFGVAFAKQNPWSDKTAFLCVGLVACLDVDGVPQWLRKAAREVPQDAMFPWDLYKYLLNAQMGAKAYA